MADTVAPWHPDAVLKAADGTMPDLKFNHRLVTGGDGRYIEKDGAAIRSYGERTGYLLKDAVLHDADLACPVPDTVYGQASPAVYTAVVDTDARPYSWRRNAPLQDAKEWFGLQTPASEDQLYDAVVAKYLVADTDISANIVYTPDGTVAPVDFGLAGNEPPENFERSALYEVRNNLFDAFDREFDRDRFDDRCRAAVAALDPDAVRDRATHRLRADWYADHDERRVDNVANAVERAQDL